MKRSSSKADLHKTVKVRVPRDYPWHVLSSLTEDLGCCLTKERQDDIRRIIRNRDFAEYMSLSETWGLQGITSDSMQPSEFFAAYQASSVLRKFQFPSDAKARRLAAFEKFQAAEEACRRFNTEGVKTLAFLEEDDELSVYTYARKFLQDLLGNSVPEPAKLTLWSRHGPGANLDTTERAVSLYDKYRNWPYSCTHDALRHARLAVQNDERWLGALEDSYRDRFEIPKHVVLNQEVFWSSVFAVVPGNRITFVPKNSLTDRSIAIEPAMNLYLQLGVDGFIRRRLMRWGVNLDDQTKNQVLAGVGSLNWESQDSYVTLDLAAASDSVSTGLCRLLLPPQWYTYLMQLRSPQGECDGQVFEFQKISSMGNGYTFALESAIFASVVYGVERVVRGSFKQAHVAVYGDDLIVRRQSAELVVRMLNRFGFSVNSDKTFLEGPFRESCGADWFKGTPVRPVFLKSSPSTVMELWCDANRFRRILSLRRDGFRFKVCDLIDKWIPPQFHHVVGPYSDEDFDSYKHVPVPNIRYKRGLWEFNRVVVTPTRLKGRDFLFRKLMHPLRASPSSNRPTFWGGARLASVGSRFTVTRSNAVTVRETSSVTSNWSSEYTDLITLKR